jgi:hypothetical protein
VWPLFFLVSLVGVRLSPLGTSATVGLLYQSRMIDYDDYGAVGGIRIGRGNRSTRTKPAPVPLCPPQIPLDLTWDRTRAAAVGSQRLTAWAVARPVVIVSTSSKETGRWWVVSGTRCGRRWRRSIWIRTADSVAEIQTTHLQNTRG